jgi:tetratricopeptide (TPR) repeat protein
MAVASAGASPDDPTGQAAVEAAFRAALQAGPRSAEQVRLLEQVAKEGPQTRWADDALWMLGEMARQADDPRHAVYYWQYLAALCPDVVLEDDTKALDVYAKSGIPQVELYLQLTASRYVSVEAHAPGAGQPYMGLRPVSPAAMLVWQGLGEAYEALGKRRLALRAYRHALANCPKAGNWHERFEKALGRLADAEPDAVPEEAATDAPEEAPSEPSAVGLLTGDSAREAARTAFP